MMTDTRCFTLRVQLYAKVHNRPLIIIDAYDDLGWDEAGRVRLTCEVRHAGKVIFPKGQLTCALHRASDGIEAKELVMSLVAMKPGDTDEDYFADYTSDQLDWVESYGEAMNAERELRYCDPETGEVKRPKQR